MQTRIYYLSLNILGAHSNVFILQLNLLAAIVLLTIALGIFLRKNSARPNIFLGILMLYPALSIILNIVFIVLAQHRLLFLAPMNVGFNLTFGPVLLTYLHFIQGKSGKSPLHNLTHFIPALFVFISAFYYVFLPETKQLTSLNLLISGELFYVNLINLFLLIHIGVYLYIGWKQVKIYAKGASDLEIPETENSVKWQQSFLRIIVSINILLLLSYALPILWTGKAHIYSDLIAAPLCALFLYSFMLYKGLTYHVIYNKPEYTAFTSAAKPLHNFITELKSQEQNAHESIYKDEQVMETKIRLQELFEEQKIFTQAGLKLHDMAQILKVSPALLSFVLNKHLEMTFFEMLSKYRVNEAKQLLVNRNYSHYKIEYIGEISGFNSRASFFSVFKKQVGKTPLAYRDEHMECLTA